MFDLSAEVKNAISQLKQPIRAENKYIKQAQRKLYATLFEYCLAVINKSQNAEIGLLINDAAQKQEVQNLATLPYLEACANAFSDVHAIIPDIIQQIALEVLGAVGLEAPNINLQAKLDVDIFPCADAEENAEIVDGEDDEESPCVSIKWSFNENKYLKAIIEFKRVSVMVVEILPETKQVYLTNTIEFKTDQTSKPISDFIINVLKKEK